MKDLCLEYLGIINPAAVHHNMTVPQLVERAVARGEGTLSKTGALVVKTGKYTGRSPEDRFVVDSPPSTTRSSGVPSISPSARPSTTPSTTA